MVEDAVKGPLSGVRVVDMTVALAGPFTTLLLAAMGAEVIKVEAPGGGDLARSNPPYVGKNGVHLDSTDPDDMSVFWLNRSRNKRSITLNLKTARGKELLYDLVETSDIFVENLSDGVAERIGAGYETLRERNKRLVYCSISGVTPENRFSGIKIMDILVQALSGIMDVTGDPGAPPMRVGIPIGDLCGPLFALSGILGALRVSEKTGVGQKVSVSLVDVLSLLVAEEHFDALSRAGVQTRSGNTHSRLAPFGVYPCTDGFVAIAALMDDWFLSLARAMNMEELASDERFLDRSSRVDSSKELDEIISRWTQVRSKDDVVRILFTEAGVPVVPVQSVNEMLADEALHSSGAVATLRHPDPDVKVDLTGSGIPWRFSMSPVGLDRVAPRLGADNDEVFGNLLGIDGEELDDLRKKRVI